MPPHFPAARPTRVRFGVLAMLFVTIAINYLDRSNLSVAAPGLAGDLHFDPRKMGLIFSAFGWAYVLLQIPGGWLADRLSLRGLYALACLLWSIATVLQGFAGSFLALFALRLLLGAFEAPSFPICSRVVTLWFPERERAGATGCYIAGEFVGLAFLTPVLMLTQRKFGWQAVFIMTGGIGLLWAGVWYRFYRDPAQSRRINSAEMEHIRSGGGWVEGGAAADRKANFQWSDLASVLRHRQLWGIYAGQYANSSMLWFFLTWFPTYLVKYRRFNLTQAGFLGSLPFLAAFLGVIVAGLLSDFLLRRGWSPTAARKAPLVGGLLLSTCIVGANYVENPRLVVLFLSIALFGCGCASINWALVSLLAPKRLVGLTAGVFNFLGNLPSISVPIIVSLLVSGSNFEPALVFMSGVAFAGALSFIFLVGRVERIEQ
jgi:MFS transporter, ACS family, D-galactonate transporter